MRLISQDGRGDMPYENFIFRACGGDIVASRDILTNKKQIVARYSTESKALKVMEMLREQYQYGKKIAVPKLEENGIAKDDNVMLFNTRLINDFFKGGTYLPVKVFKFPADEEMEV